MLRFVKSSAAERAMEPETWRADETTWARTLEGWELAHLLNLHAKGYGVQPGFAVEVPSQLFITLKPDIRLHFKRVTTEWRAKLDAALELEDAGK